MSEQRTRSFGSVVDTIEEAIMAMLLAAMTLITFANVVARYVFNSNILWALEVTVFLFAWLVLLGASYAVKKHIHIGVDVIIARVGPGARKVMAILAVSACLAFSLMLLKGSWDYWYPFVTKRAFLETEDVPMPEFLQFLSDALNEGERYENMPRFIPYFVLPLSMALLAFRYLQLTWKVLTGEADMVIANHEPEELSAFKEAENLDAGSGPASGRED
jgi:C4-dicarboxylate transporter DctQ subunit